MNIAVIVTGGAVETLQVTPLLTALGAVVEGGRPSHRIVLACPAGYRSLTAGLPAADEVLPMAALGDGTGGAASLPGAVLAMRRRRLDVALVCATRPIARVLAYAAGIPTRVGADGGATAALLTDRIPTQPTENRAAVALRLAGHLGLAGRSHVPAFDPGDAARKVAEERLLGQGFEDGRLLVALAPGAGWLEPPRGLGAAALAWDPERFAHLANQLCARHGAGIVLLGAAPDREVVDRVLVHLDAPRLDLCGEIDLTTAAAVVERCDLVVAGDGPLLQLAAALGTPAIGLFGATDGHARGPYGPQHRVVQGVATAVDRTVPRGAERAIAQIRVDDVLAGIEAAL